MASCEALEAAGFRVWRLAPEGEAWVAHCPGFVPATDRAAVWARCACTPEEQALIERPSGAASLGAGEAQEAAGTDTAAPVRTRSAMQWAHDCVTVGTRQTVEPRFTTLLGVREGLAYHYSGKGKRSVPFPAEVEEQRARLTALVGGAAELNVALCNYYKNGSHHVSWHSDAEADLVPGAPIATLSFGATREFQLRSKAASQLLTRQHELHARLKQDPGRAATAGEQRLLALKPLGDPAANLTIRLADGDALVMGGTLQTHWRHRVPRERGEVGPRLVMTFRSVRGDALRPA